jgi:hypothetical protein
MVAVMLDPGEIGGQNGRCFQTPLEMFPKNSHIATTCVSAMRPDIPIGGATPQALPDVPGFLAGAPTPVEEYRLGFPEALFSGAC